MSMKENFLTPVIHFRTIELYALQVTSLHETLQVTIVISIIFSITEHVAGDTFHTWQTQQLLV